MGDGCPDDRHVAHLSPAGGGAAAVGAVCEAVHPSARHGAFRWGGRGRGRPRRKARRREPVQGRGQGGAMAGGGGVRGGAPRLVCARAADQQQRAGRSSEIPCS